MKKVINILLLALLCIGSPLGALAANMPKQAPALYVNDYAGIIEDDDEKEMLAYGRQIKEQCGVNVVVATVNFLDGLTVEEYGYDLYDTWQLASEEEDDGILLLMSLGDREINITTGTYMNSLFPSSLAGEYLDQYAYPYLEQNDYSKGLHACYQAICEKVASIYGVDASESAENNSFQGGAITGGTDSYDDNYYYNEDYGQEGGSRVLEIILGIVIVMVILSIIRTASRGVGRVGAPRYPRRRVLFWPMWTRPHRHHGHDHYGPRRHGQPPPPPPRAPYGGGRPPQPPPPRSAGGSRPSSPSKPSRPGNSGTGSFGGGSRGSASRSFGGGRSGGGGGGRSGGGSRGSTSRKF